MEVKIIRGLVKWNLYYMSLIRYVSTRSGPSPDPRAHSEKLVRSSTVNLNVRIGSFGVLSELCLAHAITPDACVLSDKTDFKIDRALYKPNDCTNPPAGGTGGQSADWVSVKLLRLHSRSQAKLVAIKQVSTIAS